MPSSTRRPSQGRRAVKTALLPREGLSVVPCHQSRSILRRKKEGCAGLVQFGHYTFDTPYVLVPVECGDDRRTLAHSSVTSWGESDTPDGVLAPRCLLAAPGDSCGGC